MKRLDLMSKEEIIKVMKVNGYCEECIVPKEYCYGKIVNCSRIKEMYLNEEVKLEKKRRCDIYSKEELADRHNAHCSRHVCSNCDYTSSKLNCKYNFAYEEVEVVDGKEV